MVKKYLRLTIIVMAQCILPILTLLLIAPWVINQSSLMISWQALLTKIKFEFFILHSLFYLAVIFLWPKLVYQCQNTQLSAEQLKTVLNIRWYLIAAFLFFDALMFWR